MNLSTTVKRRIDEYNPKGFLAHTAKLILALCGVNHFSTQGHIERVALMAERTAAMIISSLIWFSTFSSFIITSVIGGALLFLFVKASWSGRWFLILAGTLSILYVIQDYRIGPSSDLEAFASVVGLTPLIWMYLWLGVALSITATFLWVTFKKLKKKQ